MKITPKTNALDLAKERLYNGNFELSNLIWEKESIAYEACSYQLNDKHIISRKSKITPKKIGQFVTLWKRIGNQVIQPFYESDSIDFVVVHVCNDDSYGQFVFPKSVLIKRGVFASETKKGKLAIRVYPPWDIAISKQAKQTQKWQLEYFLPIGPEKANSLLIKKLYLNV